MRVGARSAAPSVVPSNGASSPLPLASTIRRISEKPFECGPDDASPMTDVAGGDGPAVDDAGLLDHADGESREVVLAVVVHAGHFGGLAADERAARRLAAGGDALDHVGGDVDVELAAREVVEEEQRLGALHEDVVDAHRDQVDADRVVAVERERELQLGADAVGAGDEHRLAEALADLDQPAEAADAREHFGPHRALRERLDALDQRIARRRCRRRNRGT